MKNLTIFCSTLALWAAYPAKPATAGDLLNKENFLCSRFVTAPGDTVKPHPACGDWSGNVTEQSDFPPFSAATSVTLTPVEQSLAPLFPAMRAYFYPVSGAAGFGGDFSLLGQEADGRFLMLPDQRLLAGIALKDMKINAGVLFSPNGRFLGADIKYQEPAYVTAWIKSLMPDVVAKQAKIEAIMQISGGIDANLPLGETSDRGGVNVKIRVTVPLNMLGPAF